MFWVGFTFGFLSCIALIAIRNFFLKIEKESREIENRLLQLAYEEDILSYPSRKDKR